MFVSRNMVDDLVQRARSAENGRFRLCCHTSVNANIQEMVIALTKSSLFSPHRHRPDSSESYHVIAGSLRVFFFDDGGSVVNDITLRADSPQYPFMYRLSAPIWHLPIAETEIVVYHETLTGPFQKNRDVEYAPFAPPENDQKALRRFHDGLLKEVGSREKT